MSQSRREILVTAALPYANGPLHLGHLLGYIQGDIWCRFQRMLEHTCYYICGSDAHGTPIMLKANELGISPEDLVEKNGAAQQKDFDEFYVNFDNFYTTHSEENKNFACEIYNKLNQNGDIVSHTIHQAFDPEKNMFLPDRFVKGECPKCHAQDQYGDSCEACGATYSPTDLINPISAVSGATPIEKSSDHQFFDLSRYQDFLKTWINQTNTLQNQVKNKLSEWLHTELRAWDITRDAPYFGFEIPNLEKKYFYVWLDAPMGYMASFKNYCDKTKINFDHYWNKDSTTELYHFIGKDIIYFHALFWPAILHGAGLRTPTGVFANGFVTVNGAKMSKSRGTFIKARTYLNHLNPSFLRYYFATKLSSGIDDVDLNLEDFITRVNSDVVGKVVNIASRCAGFITKKFDGKLSNKLHNPELFDLFKQAGGNISDLYETREFSHAMREIMLLADKANQYIDEHKPWVMIKDEAKFAETHEVCTMGLNCFRMLMIYLKPVLPKMAMAVEEFLNIDSLVWEDINSPLLDHAINKFKPLCQRIDPNDVEAMELEEREGA